MISFTVIFSKFCKKVQNSCIPRESVWLYVKCLNVRNFVAKHAFLNSYSCTIIVNSIYHTGFPLHLGCFYHCNLGKFVQRTQIQIGNSIFSRETFQTGAKILILFSAESLQSFYFSLFCSPVVCTCSKFAENVPKTDIYFSFFITRWHIIVQTNRNNKLFFEDKYSCKYCEASLQLFFFRELRIISKTYYNL